MKKAISLLLAVLMVSPGIVVAQDDAAPSPPPVKHPKKARKSPPIAASPAKPRFEPIEIQQFGWGRHASMGYYYEGSPLSGVGDLKRVIDPLGDQEASGLLRQADDENGLGQGLLWGGIAVEVVGWGLFVVEMTQTTTGPFGEAEPVAPNILPSMLLVIGGNFGWVIGLLKMVDGSNDQYNAVNRYNYVVNHQNGLSFMTLPQSHIPGLDLTVRF